MRGISHPRCSSVPPPPRARVEATYLPRPCMSPSVCSTSQGVTALPWLPGPARHSCSPSTRDSGRAGQSLVLACRSCLHRQPHQTCSCPSLSCAWLQDPVPPALGRENHQTPRTGLHSSVVKKKKDKNAAKQSQRPLLLQLRCAIGGRQEGASPGLSPLLGLVARGARVMAPGHLLATSAPSPLSYNF